MPWMALETSWALAACWTAAAAISEIFAAVISTPSMIFFREVARLLAQVGAVLDASASTP